MTINDLPQERRQRILDDLRRQGKVVAIELSKRYGVSQDTIRRDLGALASEGLLKRVHGGALPITPITMGFAERDKQPSQARAALARKAAELVQDGQLIIFGGGTTNAEIARNLPGDLRATVVTFSPQISLALASYPNIEIILIGGKLNKREMVTVDAVAVAQTKQFQADICFLGVCSLHPEAGFTTNMYEDVEMDRTCIEQSGEVVATVTADKLGTTSSFVVCPIDKVTHLITEAAVADDVLAPYEAQGIQVTRAE
ncbi:MAG: DeoR/GlpR family DNA-binding transcription regulator [Anaerolineaceae bacterium]|nr:DeoR/GlpR family DNA-binding transcription regulator [Anaerolineaceae bacterium]